MEQGLGTIDGHANRARVSQKPGYASESNAEETASKGSIPRVSDQNVVSLLYIMIEIHHYGREPLIYGSFFETVHFL